MAMRKSAASIMKEEVRKKAREEEKKSREKDEGGSGKKTSSSSSSLSAVYTTVLSHSREMTEAEFKKHQKEKRKRRKKEAESVTKVEVVSSKRKRPDAKSKAAEVEVEDEDEDEDEDEEDESVSELLEVWLDKYEATGPARTDYFERQKAAHCGAHAANNILGEKVFTPKSLASFGTKMQRELDRLHLENPEGLGPSREAGGWYDISLLQYALKEKGYDVHSVGGRSRKAIAGRAAGEAYLTPGLLASDLQNKNLAGFLVNLNGGHWVGVRAFPGNFWMYADSQAKALLPLNADSTTEYQMFKELIQLSPNVLSILRKPAGAGVSAAHEHFGSPVSQAFLRENARSQEENALAAAIAASKRGGRSPSEVFVISDSE